MNYDRVFKYIGVAAIIFLLIGLFGWFVFLRTQTSGIESAANARGFSIGIPSFSGSRGSTAANTSASEENTFTSNGSVFARFLGAGEAERIAYDTEEASSENAPTPGARIETGSTPRAPRLWKVTSAPVAGAAFIDGTKPKLRYVERASGHVFDADPISGTVTRITNTLTPRVYEAHIGGGGTIVQRTIEENKVVTRAGKIGTTTTEGAASLTTHSLGVEISDIALSPDSPNLFMIAQGAQGKHLLTSAWNGSAPKQLVSLPGGDFRILTVGSAITLVERAGSGIAGSAYRATAPLTSLIRNIPGLTLRIQESTGNILYGSDDGIRLRLFARLANAAAAEIPLQTIADKCVFAPKGPLAYCAAPESSVPAPFLDQWYRGEVHTDDRWYTIDLAGGTAKMLFRIDTGSGVDVENPTIDEGGSYLAFQNARDKSLWILRIAE